MLGSKSSIQQAHTNLEYLAAQLLFLLPLLLVLQHLAPVLVRHSLTSSLYQRPTLYYTDLTRVGKKTSIFLCRCGLFGELETLLPTLTKYARKINYDNYVAVSTQSMMAEMNASKQSIDKGQSNMITLKC